MTRPKRPSPAYGEELAAVLDRIDGERERLADIVKDRKGRIAALEKRARQLRDLIAGRDFEQETIPGTEVTEVLTEAAEVADRSRA